jgi:hypothetical protein
MEKKPKQTEACSFRFCDGYVRVVVAAKADDGPVIFRLCDDHLHRTQELLDAVNLSDEVDWEANDE